MLASPDLQSYTDSRHLITSLPPNTTHLQFKAAEPISIAGYITISINIIIIFKAEKSQRRTSACACQCVCWGVGEGGGGDCDNTVAAQIWQLVLLKRDLNRPCLDITIAAALPG